MLESDLQGLPMGLTFHVVNNEKKKETRNRGFMIKWAAVSLPLKENIEMNRSPKPLCL